MRWKSSSTSTTGPGSCSSPATSRRSDSSSRAETGDQPGQGVVRRDRTGRPEGAHDAGPEGARLVVRRVEGHPRHGEGLRGARGPGRGRQGLAPAGAGTHEGQRAEGARVDQRIDVRAGHETRRQPWSRQLRAAQTQLCCGGRAGVAHVSRGARRLHLLVHAATPGVGRTPGVGPVIDVTLPAASAAPYPFRVRRRGRRNDHGWGVEPRRRPSGEGVRGARPR